MSVFSRGTSFALHLGGARSQVRVLSSRPKRKRLIFKRITAAFCLYTYALVWRNDRKTAVLRNKSGHFGTSWEIRLARKLQRLATYLQGVINRTEMAKIRFVLDKRTAAASGGYPVKLGMAVGGSYMYVSLGIYLRDSQFDSRGGCNGMEWVHGHPAASKYNTRLRNVVLAVEEAVETSTRSGLRNAVRESAMRAAGLIVEQQEEDDRETLGVAFRSFIETKRARTREIYNETLKKVVLYKATGVRVPEIGLEWVRGFEAFLRCTCSLSVNTAGIHLRNLRAVLNYAACEGIASPCPFRRFVIKQEDTPKRSISAEQLATLRDWPCEEHQVRYRDIFMLSFYLLGINMVDLCSAMRSDVVNGRLEYRRAKTGKLYSIKIQPEAAEIIKRYAGKTHLLFVLEDYGDYRDFMHRLNENLQRIGYVETGNRYNAKNRRPLYPGITTYWARHSWATIAHRLGVQKDVISMALGHSFGVRITDVYIDYDAEKVDAANRLVIDRLNEIKNPGCPSRMAWSENES